MRGCVRPPVRRLVRYAVAFWPTLGTTYEHRLVLMKLYPKQNIFKGLINGEKS